MSSSFSAGDFQRERAWTVAGGGAGLGGAGTGAGAGAGTEEGFAPGVLDNGPRQPAPDPAGVADEQNSIVRFRFLVSSKATGRFLKKLAPPEVLLLNAEALSAGPLQLLLGSSASSFQYCTPLQSTHRN